MEKTSLKRERERLQRSRSRFWIEPARDVVNTLETLETTEFGESLPDISHHVRKIGTNRLISRKTVSMSLSPNYVCLPSLLASA
jgi:hypothetical protein